MARILGVDYGDRRIGVAISDETGTIAFPRETLTCGHLEQAAAAVARLAEAEQVAEIVVGEPVHMDGSRGSRAARTDCFVAELARRTAIPLRKWDERLSTRAAEAALREGGARRQRRREVVDQLAAQLILQSYLDARQDNSAAPETGGNTPR